MTASLPSRAVVPSALVIDLQSTVGPESKSGGWWSLDHAADPPETDERERFRHVAEVQNPEPLGDLLGDAAGSIADGRDHDAVVLGSGRRGNRPAQSLAWLEGRAATGGQFGVKPHAPEYCANPSRIPAEAA